MTIKDDVISERPRTARSPGTALVKEADITQDRFVLETGPQTTQQALRARSCLVQPQAGDIVAFIADGESSAYVTAVLERPNGAPLTLKLPPGTVIHAEDGALELRADTLAFRARALSLESEQAHLNVEQVVGVGQRASWSFGAVKFTADLMESFAERVLQFSRWSQRMVDGPDQVRARQIDYRAEQTMQLQAQALIASADKLFKADSDQIHLG
ncbi:MAG: DUF3540 domain-containing protein [Ottowia sp.]|uniref:DUF3540 domain-containing protein n=1 Tax=Ottowia sp. TaxID=1898956 RepID=UPI003C77E98C